MGTVNKNFIYFNLSFLIAYVMAAIASHNVHIHMMWWQKIAFFICLLCIMICGVLFGKEYSNKK